MNISSTLESNCWGRRCSGAQYIVSYSCRPKSFAIVGCALTRCGLRLLLLFRTLRRSTRIWLRKHHGPSAGALNAASPKSKILPDKNKTEETFVVTSTDLAHILLVPN